MRSTNELQQQQGQEQFVWMENYYMPRATKLSVITMYITGRQPASVSSGPEELLLFTTTCQEENPGPEAIQK